MQVNSDRWKGVWQMLHVKGVEKAGRIGKSDVHRGGHTSLHGPRGEVMWIGHWDPLSGSQLPDLGGLSRKGLWSGSGSLVLGHHALRICLELKLTCINMPSIFPIFPTQSPQKKLTCRGERPRSLDLTVQKHLQISTKWHWGLWLSALWDKFSGAVGDAQLTCPSLGNTAGSM